MAPNFWDFYYQKTESNLWFCFTIAFQPGHLLLSEISWCLTTRKHIYQSVNIWFWLNVNYRSSSFFPFFAANSTDWSCCIQPVHQTNNLKLSLMNSEFSNLWSQVLYKTKQGFPHPQAVYPARAGGGGGQAKHWVDADLWGEEVNRRHFWHAIVPALLLPGRPGYIHCDQLPLSFLFM